MHNTARRQPAFRFLCVCLAVLAALLLPHDGAARAGDTATLPFSIELGTPFSFPAVPPLQSYAAGWADVDGVKWLLVTGRTTGLHGFAIAQGDNPANNFVLAGANDRLWVLDIEGRNVWSQALGSLPNVMTDPLRATNVLACQDLRKLYVLGGYGRTASAATAGKMTTFDTLTVLDLPKVVQAVMTGESAAPYLQQTCHPELRVTGGGLLKLNNSFVNDAFVAVFGQTFDGLYSPESSHGGGGTDGPATSLFTQNYTEQVKVFKVSRDPRLRISQLQSYPQFTPFQPKPEEWEKERPFHRRDLNVAPNVTPDGEQRIAVFGGVFRPGRQFSGYTHPIFIEKFDVNIPYQVNGQNFSYTSFGPGVDAGFEQLLSQYDCAKLCMYDAAERCMYTTFFGGISEYRYDCEAHELIKDAPQKDENDVPIVDGLPFITTISTIVQRPNGPTVAYILPIELPGFLGTGAQLLVDPQTPQMENGVIELDKLPEDQPTRIGYFFGGIESEARYHRQAKTEPATKAYDKFIEVTVTRKNWNVRPMPSKPDNPD